MHSSILGWRTPLTEKPGRPQSTGLQRVGHDLSDPARIDARLFCLWQLCPMRVEHEGGAAAWLAGTLVATSVQGHGLLGCRSYGPIRVFFQASCSWRSEGLFGQCFSIALPVQAFRGSLAWVLL